MLPYLIKKEGSNAMLEMTAFEPWHINSVVNRQEPTGIFQSAENTGRDGEGKEEPDACKEDRLFSPMLKASLAALNVKEAKAVAVSGMHDIHKNIGKDSGIGKGENSERKRVLNHDDQASEEKNEERQVDITELPTGVQNINIFITDNSIAQDRPIFVEVSYEDSGENSASAAGLQHLRKGTEIQGEVLIGTITDAENGTPFFPGKEQRIDTNSIIVSNALGGKSADENDISKILASIKEGEMKLLPMERQMGEIPIAKDSGEMMFKGTPSDSENGKVVLSESLLAALRENGVDGKDINKILTVIKEGERKSFSLERKIGEAAVEMDSKLGVFKGTPSDSENGKVSLPESLLAALRENGVDGKDISKVLAVIKEGELKSVSLERRIGEAAVEMDSKLGVLKGMPSALNAKKGDCGDDSPSFSGKGKTIPEPFTLNKHTDLTAYGGDPKLIKSEDVKPLEGRLLVNQIASQLPSDMDKSLSRVRIALFPENLGGLDMDIIIRENKIHVALMADRQDVRQALQGQADQLRNALQNQGLQVEHIDFLLRDSPWEMDGGSGGSYFSWREDNSSAKGGEREPDVPAPSAMFLSVAGQAIGTEECGISLFV
jgi:hypothetical protein